MIASFFAKMVAILVTAVTAQNGPSALYTLLNGQTFNPPGYTIVMYQSCMQNQNAGNPCGSFSGYQSSNGQYTYQLYGPEAAVSPTCSRTFKLTLACGPTLQMSGVNENPTCVYSATLSLPQVCGVDLTVGNEVASVSPTALPPTTSPTTTTSLTATPTITASGTATTTLTLTATGTATASVTSTPLFQITAWPTTSSTTTLTATSTPLFMVTAWPTTSPVNVSATSTPLYYYTAYPSVGSNETGGLLSMAASLTSGASTTAVILGSVALGIVGLGAIGGAVAYFRKGGSVSGLIKKVEENKGAMTQFANALPISAENKAKLTGAIADPTSLLPPEAKAKAAELQAQAQEAFEKAKGQVEALQAQASAMNQSVLAVLPPQLSSVIQAKQDELSAQATAVIQAKKEELQSHLPPQVVSLIQSNPQMASMLATKETVAHPSNDAVISFEPTPIVEAVAEAEAVAVTAEVTHVAIKSEDLEAVKAFLAAKNVTQ